MILGCDAAGVDADGNEVIVHSVIASPDWRGDETLDPKRSLLSERHQGTLAERVAVPRGNLVPKPAALSFEEAACLPTAWLTAYRMLFVKAGVQPGRHGPDPGRRRRRGQRGDRARPPGRPARVGDEPRTRRSGEKAVELGAHEAFESGARLPERVDAVLETVGEATWKHSLRALRPGGTLVVSGSTSGDAPSAELQRVFFLQLNVIGSTMGTRDELARLARLCETSGIRPQIDRVLPLGEAREGFGAMASGDVFGKIVFTP